VAGPDRQDLRLSGTRHPTASPGHRTRESTARDSRKEKKQEQKKEKKGIERKTHSHKLQLAANNNGKERSGEKRIRIKITL